MVTVSLGTFCRGFSPCTAFSAYCGSCTFSLVISPIRSATSTRRTLTTPRIPWSGQIRQGTRSVHFNMESEGSTKT